ncbi:MAG: bifunctional precorrin-2 dehydrogenase/sirohydrochlorin ferrochelatase [Gemmataceae bacterium]|nr:bifunctional precorrin-2 dehydrogenase/sirohydrochlorin ferrochelatase [Gemmataceae bacterium]
MLPLFVNLRDRLGVVIGGGAVGRRKTSALLAAGARVRVACLEPRPADETFRAVEWLTEPYRSAHLDGASLAFAAATPDVNRRIVTDARARGVWVNSATEPEEGDFVLPAVLTRGDFAVAVGTGGHAPALARAVRDRLATEFDEAFGAWVALLAEVRLLVLAQVPADRRRPLLESLARWEWLDRLRREGVEAVRRALRAAVATLAGEAPPPV